MSIVVVGPGKVFDTEKGTYGDVTYFGDGWVYDTISYASGAVTADNETKFFQPLTTPKKRLDSNVGPDAKLPFNQDLELHRVGVHIPSVSGGAEVAPLDIKQACENFRILFKADDITVVEGPIVQYPGGHGVVGMTQVGSQGVITNGMAASALAELRMAPQFLSRIQTLQASAYCDSQTWITSITGTSFAGIVKIRLELYGKLAKAAFLA